MHAVSLHVICALVLAVVIAYEIAAACIGQTTVTNSSAHINCLHFRESMFKTGNCGVIKVCHVLPFTLLILPGGDVGEQTNIQPHKTKEQQTNMHTQREKPN